MVIGVAPVAETAEVAETADLEAYSNPIATAEAESLEPEEAADDEASLD